MADDLQTHVLIIGAGISGLLIAHGLQQAGIKYTIFETEQSGRWRSKEWSMAIHWSLPMLEKLLPPHLASKIDSHATVDPSLDYNEPPNNGAFIYDASTGEVLKDLGSANERIVRVSRRKLRTLCLEGVDVLWDHKLVGITCDDSGTVTASFENGKTYTGSVLVGADGPRSAVRSHLFTASPELGQAQAWEGVICSSMGYSYDAKTARLVRSAHPVSFIALSPEIMFYIGIQDVPDLERPETWKFFLAPAWFGQKDPTLDNAGRMMDMKKRGQNLAEPFRSAILSIPDDTEVSTSPLTYWIAKRWDTQSGRITLAGDAAHPMPPFRGQGCNNAVLDVQNFVKAMSQIAASERGRTADLQARLIQDYSEEVAKRGAAETQVSLQSGEACMAYDGFKESVYAKRGLARGSTE